ncbi:AAA-like domain-containing protein [Pseudanabaena yagii]|uniref:Anaphase-promoting complex subunit 4 WD40 domain-containing protein n=1 Tax=Pseudanabaena yagii GIHE-NHR1 TaxID=2722753 RepID=A0ABX1LSF3_9CYAN|nr:AAA-like domain-containing protein [Pseudanabaena yagii]NMF57990.1 hypothetical protein [Pseudanabaena yagii GIHE-NHR1]
MSNQNFNYQVGGSLPADAPSYVERQCDRDYYDLLKECKYCYVFNCRQMGKSSLRVRVTHKLQAEGIVCATIDPQKIGVEVTCEQWYASAIRSLVGDLNLKSKFDLRSWIRERELLSPVQRFAEFIETVVLQEIDAPIVIFVEEIDRLLSLKFGMDDFFGLVRSFFEDRPTKPEYNRLTFSFLGVATPTDLIQSHNTSAFNIGYAVEMAGFTLAEALPLMQGLASKVANPQDYLEEAVKWTGGQPFLIQRLLGMMEKELAGIATPENIAAWVENLVQERIVTNWESQDAPPHLTTIRDRVLSVEEKLRGRMLGCYQQVLADGELEDDRSEERSKLRLTGLVVRRDGRLISYNPIYAAVFNNAWVEGQLADLRPEFYASAFRAWQGSEIKDGFLLRGEALRNAEIWARGKRLSDGDEDFLRESREVEKVEVVLKLEAERLARKSAEEANQILIEAEQIARNRVRSGTLILAGILTGTVLAAGLVIAGASLSLKEAKQSTEQSEVAKETALRQIALAQVKLESVNAKVAFLDNRGIESQLLALRAGYKLKQIEKSLIDWQEIKQSDVVPILQQTIYRVPQINHFGQKLVSANFSNDGSKIFTTSEDKKIRTWDLKGNIITVIELTGYTKQIWNANFSSDGSKILTSSNDGTVEVWDLKGSLIASLKGHTSEIASANFSPDGSKIVTASADKTTRIWNTNGSQIAELKGHTDSVYSANFSPDGSKIITASWDKTARLWDLDGNQITEFNGHTDPILSANFSHDGSKVITASWDKTARLWDLDGNQITEFKGHTKRLSSANFSLNDNKIVTTSDDGTTRIWDNKGNQIDELKGSISTNASFSPDGNKIVTVSADKTLRVWNIKGSQIAELKNNKDIVWSANFSPDGSKIFTTSIDTTAESMIGRVWDINGNQIAELKGTFIKNFSPDSSKIITTSIDNKASLWDFNGNLLAEFKGHQGQVNSANFSPDGSKIVTASFDKTAKLWGIKGNLITELKDHKGIIWNANFSPDGSKIVTASFDKTAKVWDIQGNLVADLKGHPDIVGDANFSPDGNKIVTASFKIANVWDIKGNLIAELRGHTSTVRSPAFSPDGNKIVTSSDDKTARVWDVKGNLIAELKGDIDIGSNANFSPDGSKIVTTSDKTVQVWDVLGNLITELKGHTKRVNSANFSSDGSKIVTASVDGTARVWEVKIEGDLHRLLILGCDKLHDYLTNSEIASDEDRQMCGIAPRQK